VATDSATDTAARGGVGGGGWRRLAAVAALVLGLAGLAISAAGLAIALLPRQFSAADQQKIMDWEVQQRWRVMTAGQIFPGSVGYQLPAGVIQDAAPVSLQAVRVGIAAQSPCASGVTDRQAAAVLLRYRCQALLRATYVDQTSSFVMTVGIAVLPSADDAAAASAGLAGTRLDSTRDSGALPSGVGTMRFNGTAGMYDYRRQLAGGMTAGPYLVLYAAGYSDGRPRVPIGHDSYSLSEMDSMAQGVAQSVASALGATPPAPHCPGSPGC
jgi:hypothetical protein